MPAPTPGLNPDISIDQAIKDVLSRYPVDAWRFLLPDLAGKLGDPVSWQIQRSEARMRKKIWNVGGNKATSSPPCSFQP